MGTEYVEKWPTARRTCDDFFHLVQTMHIKGFLISRPASKHTGASIYLRQWETCICALQWTLSCPNWVNCCAVSKWLGSMCEREVQYERQRLWTELWPRAYVVHEFLCCTLSFSRPSYSLHNNNITSVESNETRCQGVELQDVRCANVPTVHITKHYITIQYSVSADLETIITYNLIDQEGTTTYLMHCKITRLDPFTEKLSRFKYLNFRIKSDINSLMYQHERAEWEIKY
jgi:hypothetical protein